MEASISACLPGVDQRIDLLLIHLVLLQFASQSMALPELSHAELCLRTGADCRSHSRGIICCSNLQSHEPTGSLDSGFGPHGVRLLAKTKG